MASHETGAESEYEPMSAVRRYYNDILSIQTRSDALLALHNLYELLPCIPSFSYEAIAESTLVPLEDEFMLEPQRIAKERLALLPLIAFGDDVDQSQCSVNEAREWFKDVIGHIRMVVDDDHGVPCLEYEGGSKTHKACVGSSVCPWRYLEQYLGDPLDKGFDAPLYEDRPGRARQLALAKLEIGKRHGILLPIYADETAKSYDEALLQYLLGTDDISQEAQG